MFNKRSQEIRFITNEPTQLIVAQDTLTKTQEECFIFVKRSRTPFPIQIQGDSILKTFFFCILETPSLHC